MTGAGQVTSVEDNGIQHRRYAAGLEPQYRQMLEARDVFFGGSWESLLTAMHEALGNRVIGMSEKTVENIGADIRRIGTLMIYEREKQVNLRDYI
jgi:hypothetical protein